MSHNSFRETKGKQALLFGSASGGKIALITLLYLLNVAALLVFDNFLIHTIPGDGLTSQISGELLDACEMDRNSLILYRNEAGERVLVQARKNLLGRFRLEEGTVLGEELWVQDGVFLDCTVEGDRITSASHISLLTGKLETGLLIGLSFLLTVLERQLMEKLRGK